MTTPVKKIQATDELLNRVQDSVLPPLNALLQIPTLDGRIVDKDIAGAPLVLSATTVNVPHRLGRRITGWQVIDQNANAQVWLDDTTINPDPTKFLRLKASGTVTVKLWVF